MLVTDVAALVIIKIVEPMQPKTMNINLIVKDQLKSGHFHNIEEVIGEALQVLSEKDRSRSTDTENGAQREAVREMLTFVERNRVRLESVTVKQLIHEGHRLRVISYWTRPSRSSGFLKTKRIENTAWPSLLVFPRNAPPWSLSCDSMKLATASSWPAPAGANESPSIRLTVS